jgi:hypothetical protein
VADHNGNLKKIPVGVPVVKSSNGVHIFNNRNFTSEEADNLANVLTQLAKGYLDNGTLDDTLVKYVKGLVYWRKPALGTNASPNQLYLDSDTGNLMIGRDVLSLFDHTVMSEVKGHISRVLQTKYGNVNNKYLTQEPDQPFNEIHVDEKGRQTVTTWKSYRHYLLSDKTPDGKDRAGATPLFTRIKKLTSDPNSYNFRRYATIDNLAVPAIEIKPEYTPGVRQGRVERVTKPATETEKKQATEADAEIAKLMEQRDLEIKELGKPKIAKLEFIPDDKLPQKKEIATYKGSKVGTTLVTDQAIKAKQDAIKDRFDKLEKVIECL